MYRKMIPNWRTLAVLLLLSLAALLAAATAQTVGASPAFEPEADCPSSSQAESQQKTQGITATYLVSGWTGAKGTRLEAYANGVKLGCILTEERQEQYLLVQGRVPIGALVNFKRNGKQVAVGQEVRWQPDVVINVALVKPTPIGEIKCDHVALGFQNLVDRFNGNWAITMARPSGEQISLQVPLAATPGQQTVKPVNNIGILTSIHWQVTLEGELIDQGAARDLACDSDHAIILSVQPGQVHRGDDVIAYGAGLGNDQGRLILRVGTSSRDDIVVSQWTNWTIKFQIPNDIRIETWQVVAQKREGNEWVDSNTIPLRVFISYFLYLPRIDRGRKDWR